MAPRKVGGNGARVEWGLQGCYRNCFQQHIVALCGCGDPRFPLPPLTRACAALNPLERLLLLLLLPLILLSSSS